MTFLANPNLAYVLIVIGITLLFLAKLNSKPVMLKIGVALCLIAAVLGFLYLRVNPWAFLVVALSPLPFFRAVNQAHPRNPLFLIAIFMLTIGSFLLFVDRDNQLRVNTYWAWGVSVTSATILWLSTARLRNVDGVRLNSAADSVVGIIGKTITDIEPHSAGSVLVEGDVWQAISKNPIPAGSTVRVLRQDGFGLTVKKVEKLTKR